MTEYKYGAIVELYSMKIVSGTWSMDKVVDTYKDRVTLRVQEMLDEKEKGENK